MEDRPIKQDITERKAMEEASQDLHEFIEPYIRPEDRGIFEETEIKKNYATGSFAAMGKSAS